LVKDNEKARNDRARDIGLFRYGLVRDAADPSLSAKQRGELIREISQAAHRLPDGQWIQVSRSTLDRWVRDWRRGGFDALVPSPRQVTSRLPESSLAMAVALKKENLGRTAAQVHRIMRETNPNMVVPSERTLQRHFAELGLHRVSIPKMVFGRFEADQANARWTGDCLHGPQIGGAKAILFAWIDDHSRLLTAFKWVRREDTIRCLEVLRAGIQTFGIPESVYLDNGAPFVDGQLNRTLATLGVKLVHSRPGQPAGRGKIERFFRTVRDQFLVEITETNPVNSMDELNEKFSAWIHGVYHTTVHSETGQEPAIRYDDYWDNQQAKGQPGPNYATSTQLHEAFLWTARRQVTKTALVNFEGNQYEVDPALVGCQIELTFDPFNLEHIEVKYRGRHMGAAIVHEIKTHTHRKARPDETTTEVIATGIDYLKAVEAKTARQATARISFAAITSNDELHRAGDGGDDTVTISQPNINGGKLEQAA